MKKERGITLISLIIIIVVLLILASISIGTGIDSLDSTKLKGFYMQLEMIQKRVDEIETNNESYIDNDGNTVYIKNTGTSYSDLNSEKQELLQNIISEENLEISPDNFKYFTTEELKNNFNLFEVDYNVFIEFANRIIIAEDGITIKDKTYHVLKNDTYFVSGSSSTKNEGQINSLNYSNIINYEGEKYKVTVTPSNTVGDINGTGYIKYKKSTSQYWQTSNDSTIVIEKNTEYDLIYEDLNKNSITKKIKLEFDESNNPDIREINNGGN